MAKQKRKNISDEPVYFVSSSTAEMKTGVRLQSLLPQKTLAKKAGEVKEDYEAILNQIDFIIGDTDTKIKESGFKLEQIKIGLGFNAKGKIAFIAEAGVEASIEVLFKRKE